MKSKRGVSPVIATVLLIAIVIVIAFIVFSWVRGMGKEAITKFEGTNVELVCDRVMLDASYNSGYLYVSNMGDVPIYKLKAKVESRSGSKTDQIYAGWSDEGLLQGKTYSGPFTADGDKIVLIPVLIGLTEDNVEKAYTCEEKSGVEISIA